MTNEQKYILQLIDKFVEQKGKGSCYAFKPIKPENVLISFINLHRQKRKDTSIFIAVKDFELRTKIKTLLEKYDLLDNVIILTQSYIKMHYHYNYYFAFTVGINDRIVINHLAKECKFIFNIITSDLNAIIRNSIDKVAPFIIPNITFSDLSKDRTKHPVEEMHIGVDMSDDDIRQSKEYDEYLTTSMGVFGSFENADRCRVGDNVLNISAGQFRYDLAKENGWSETLDMSIDFNVEIDKIYNPNALFERANVLYNVIRERSKLLTDNNAKLPAIVDIINKHPDKKILIISKRGEFANIIANYINDNTPLLCGEYHDAIPEQYIRDETGDYIRYKSGENKGKPKLFKSKALSTMCLDRFNSSDKSQSINLLSIKNSSDTKLKTAIDVVIFTSALCTSVNEFINRFDGIELNSNPIYSYVLYCNDSSEYQKLANRQITNNVKLIESEKNIEIDEENGAVHL